MLVYCCYCCRQQNQKSHLWLTLCIWGGKVTPFPPLSHAPQPPVARMCRWRWLPRHAVTYDFSVESSLFFFSPAPSMIYRKSYERLIYDRGRGRLCRIKSFGAYCRWWICQVCGSRVATLLPGRCTVHFRQPMITQNRGSGRKFAAAVSTGGN